VRVEYQVSIKMVGQITLCSIFNDLFPRIVDHCLIQGINPIPCLIAMNCKNIDKYRHLLVYRTYDIYANFKIAHDIERHDFEQLLLSTQVVKKLCPRLTSYIIQMMLQMSSCKEYIPDMSTIRPDIILDKTVHQLGDSIYTSYSISAMKL
jgi:hypothetical protein